MVNKNTEIILDCELFIKGIYIIKIDGFQIIIQLKF